MDSFSLTLSRLSSMINSRLRPNVSKIWVQGYNSSNVKLVFTIFYNDHTPYTMRFTDIRNFRHYREDSLDQENELRLLEAYMTSFRKTLNDVIE